MPRNLVPNHFENNGIYVEGERSTFRFNKPVLQSCMAGMLVPLGDPIPVFPGVKLDLAIDAVIRSNTMVVPPLDGLFIDWFAVWVPHRIVFNHMPQFLGENDTTAWTQTNSYVYPYVTGGKLNNTWSALFNDSSVSDASVTLGNISLADKYGLITGSVLADTQPYYSMHINILAFRGYYSIWNYLFRDENYQRPVLFSKGDTGDTGEFGYLLRDYGVSSEFACSDIGFERLGETLGSDQAVLMPVNKLHDVITSVLPQAQFGDPVTMNLGTSAPVKVVGPLSSYADLAIGIAVPGSATTNIPVNMSFNPSTGSRVDSISVVADLSNATAATINTLRTSIMYQRYLEALARGGRRMPEYYANIYQVRNSAAQCDYPELITRSRYQLGVNQVVATADSSGDGWSSHLGDTGAYSLTVLRNIPAGEKDYSEFGYLHLLYAIRCDNRYSQALAEHFTRSQLLDEYNPYFDHIGDVQLVNTTVNKSVSTAGNFGFTEAWWSERTQLSMATGALNKKYGSLKYWILGEIIPDSLTSCTPGFLTFDPAVLNDIFVSAYYAYPQFIVDARIHGKKIARMSQHSTPGIVGRI